MFLNLHNFVVPNEMGKVNFNVVFRSFFLQYSVDTLVYIGYYTFLNSPQRVYNLVWLMRSEIVKEEGFEGAEALQILPQQSFY